MQSSPRPPWQREHPGSGPTNGSRAGDEHPEAAHAAPIRVLLVEDTPEEVLLLQLALRSDRHTAFHLTQVSRLAEAQALLAREEFEVVLLDLSLPDAHAAQGVARLRAAAPRVPVVVLAGPGEGEAAARAMEAGAQDLLERGRADEAGVRRALRRAAARRRGESGAERGQTRHGLLVEAGRTLGSSLDPGETLRGLARLAVPALADWCVVTLVEEGGMRVAEVVAADPRKEAVLHTMFGSHRSSARHVPHVVDEVVETSEARLLATLSPEALAEIARDEEHLRLLYELGPRSSMCVPLVARGRLLGAVTLTAAESGRHYTADDLELAGSIASRAALALENARLYQAAQAAQRRAEEAAERTARLQAVTASLSEALTPQQVADVVVGQGVAALGGIAGGVALLSEDGASFRMLRSMGVPEEALHAWQHFPAGGGAPMCDAVRSGAPLLIGSAESLALRYPDFAALHLTFSRGAVVAVPLLLEGRALGALGLSFAEWREFSAEDEAFLMAVARQCAQALERARLYEREQQARAEAERAARGRDGVLGFVAHDLRNPLNAIELLASLLQEAGLPEELRQRHLRTILRSVHQMEHLISDLLDVTRMDAGRLRLEPRPTEAAPLLREAWATLEAALADRGVALVRPTPPPLPAVMADSDRVVQVFSNLIGNALRFTPRGGAVTVGAEPAGAAVRFYVADTGVGIDADHLPHLFDRFWQAHPSHEGGAGLGLAICKGIVEEHGGRIWVESEPGVGSTFSFTLPAV